MKLLFVFFAVAAVAVQANAQNVAIDSISGQRVLIGPVKRSAFQDSSWYKKNYTLYEPTEGLIHRIDSLGTGDSVSVVFGSWCPDSHMWVPMFLSIMNRTALARSIGFIAVPESRAWRDQLTRGLSIKSVPTFIFYHDGAEIGRITEEPKGDIGDNIVEILKAGTK